MDEIKLSFKWRDENFNKFVMRMHKAIETLENGDEVFLTYCFSYPVIKDGVRSFHSDSGIIGDINNDDILVPFAITENMKKLIEPNIKDVDAKFKKCVKFFGKTNFQVNYDD